MLPLLLLPLACGGHDHAPAADPDRPDVLLVTMDTTRDDVVDARTTPHVAALADAGVRFDWALAHAPTTLSSHASVFTGLDSHRHGVARNGNTLAATIPTLAEKFAAAGYDTIGIVGASALASETGIGRGFSVWDDVVTRRHNHRFEARASEVTARALARTKKRQDGRPLFLFVHYYDAHAPYDAPEPFTRKWSDPGYAGYVDGTPESTQRIADELRAGTAKPADLAELFARYRGEVSNVDDQIGQLLDGLHLHDPVVAIFGDHGEMFGEEPARPLGHGPDVDLPATHVPLVLSGHGVPAGRHVAPQVGLSDLGSTLLALSGVGGTLGDGTSLVPMWEKGAPGRTVLMEATQPDTAARATGWPNLTLERGIASDGYLLTRAPWLHQAPALFRIAPGQPLADDTERAARMTRDLDAWDASAPGWTGKAPSPEMMEGLKALGYVEDGAGIPSGDPAGDPPR